MWSCYNFYIDDDDDDALV